MLIGHISDLHVRPEGQLYQGVVDSNAMLEDAVRHLNALHPQPDVVLVGGDIVDHGQPDEYQAACARLAQLAMPFLVIPGNHDDRENFRTAFADHAYLPREGPLHWCVDTHPVRLIGLDSCVPGRHHGDIDAAGLQWLRTALLADRAKPTVVLLHHPPFASGIPYMDTYRYMAPEPLAAVLQDFDCIELVLCGHVHRTMLRRWAGTVVASCPSTTTEIALQFAPDAPPQSWLAPPACMLHRWDAAQGMLSHLSAIGRFPGPYGFA